MKENQVEKRNFRTWIMMEQVRRLLFNVRNYSLLRYNIPRRQAALFFSIPLLGNKATPSGLSRWLILSPNTVSERLAALMEKGLINKVNDLEKKNLVRIELSKKGRKIYRESGNQEIIQEMMSCLSDDEHKQLTAALEKISNKVLNKLQETSRPPFPLLMKFR